MTSKSKKGAAVHKGKKAAAASKSEVDSDKASKVVEVSEEHKVSAAVDDQPEQNKPSEKQADAIAEHLVAEARKPLIKNDSQSSLAGSVTVSIVALSHSNHCTVLQAGLKGIHVKQR